MGQKPFIKKTQKKRPGFPIEYLEEQRNYCLHNFGCALEQVFDSETGTEKRKKGCKWMIRTLEVLNEIETLIEEIEREIRHDHPPKV